jgi:hypothetical protein
MLSVRAVYVLGPLQLMDLSVDNLNSIGFLSLVDFTGRPEWGRSAQNSRQTLGSRSHLPRVLHFYALPLFVVWKAPCNEATLARASL